MENEFAVDFETLEGVIRGSREREEPKLCASCSTPLNSFSVANGFAKCGPCRRTPRPSAYKVCATPGCTNAVSGNNSTIHCTACRRERQAVAEVRVPQPEKEEDTSLADTVAAMEPYPEDVPPPPQPEESPAMSETTATPEAVTNGFHTLPPEKKEAFVSAIHSGIERARSEGKRIGRKPANVDQGALIADRASGMTLRQLAKKHGCSTSTASRLLLGTLPSLPVEGEPATPLPPWQKTELEAPQSQDEEREAMTLLFTSKQADLFFAALSLNDRCSILQGFIDQLGE